MLGSSGLIAAIAPERSERREKRIAAIGAVPYAARSETWFAFSNLSFGTRLKPL